MKKVEKTLKNRKNIKKIVNFSKKLHLGIEKELIVCYNIGEEMKIVANNKKAYHNFFVSDTLEAGISLKGGEIKSVSGGRVSLSDSFVTIQNGEAFLKNCYIAPLPDCPQSDSECKRTRKLLLHKEEIIKWERKVSEKGFSIVPTKIYMTNGKAKVEIALAKGKKLYDKRDVLREKAIQRDIDRAIKDA